MENIKIENTSSYQNLKSWNEFWLNELGIVENKLELNPDSFFLQGQKKVVKEMVKEANNELNDFIYKYGK